MRLLTPVLRRKYEKIHRNFRHCPVCGEIVDPYSSKAEYVRTKRKTDIFVHRDCVKDWGGEKI